ncbi:MAG: hypothetical protein ACTSXF_06900, partial [Promethearchaeota archaeon]
WSPNSIYNNREAGIIVQSNSVAGYYLDLYNYDWDACEDFDPNYTTTSSGGRNSSFLIWLLLIIGLSILGYLIKKYT